MEARGSGILADSVRQANSARLQVGCAIVVLLAGGFLNGCSELVGTSAPAFELSAGTGDSVSLVGLQGDVVVVSFWATWCGPCRQELPELWAAQQQLGDRVRIVLISREGPEVTEPFLSGQGIGLTSLWDDSGSVHDAYGVFGIPTLFVVDRAGVVRERHVGYEGGLAERLRATVASL